MELRKSVCALFWISCCAAAGCGDDGGGTVADAAREDATADDAPIGTDASVDAPDPGDPMIGRWISNAPAAPVTPQANQCQLPSTHLSFTLSRNGQALQAVTDHLMFLESGTNLRSIPSLTLPCTLQSEPSFPGGMAYACTGGGAGVAFSILLPTAPGSNGRLDSLVGVTCAPGVQSVLAGSYARWTPPNLTCGSSTITPTPAPGSSVLAAVLAGYYQDEWPLYRFSTPANTASFASVTDGSGAALPVVQNTWRPVLAPSSRFAFRLEPDTQSTLVFFPATYAGFAGTNAPGMDFGARLYARPLITQTLVLAGMGPQTTGYGFLEVQAFDAGGGVVTGARVQVGAPYEHAFNLRNLGALHIAEEAMTSTSGPGMLTRGGNVYMSNVCPGMVSVMVTSATDQPCHAAPAGTGASSLDVPVRAGETTTVRFTCPSQQPALRQAPTGVQSRPTTR